MTFSEFVNMGGYGYFIWMCFGMVALVMFAEPLFLRLQRKALKRKLDRVIRMNKRENQSE
ncbi:MAG TPA: heme exporter protein CcmD [Thiothrix sp.]|nr:heme exporter protein CcmD [Thiothrix sp.]